MSDEGSEFFFHGAYLQYVAQQEALFRPDLLKYTPYQNRGTVEPYALRPIDSQL